MGKFIKILLPLICWVASATAQEITTHEASVLQRKLNDKKLTAAEKIETLLTVSHYYVLKPESREEDMDSALVHWNMAMSLVQSTGLKKDLGFAKWTQYMYLVESTSGVSWELVDQAIPLLIKSNDKFHLAMAYLRTAAYRMENKPAERQNLQIEVLKLVEASGTRNQKLYAFKELQYLYEILPPETDAGKYEYLLRLMKMVLKADDSQIAKWTFDRFTDIRKNKYNGKMAVTTLNELLEVCRSKKKSWIGKIYVEIGRSHVALSDFSAAVQSFLLAERTVRNAVDSVILYHCYLGLASAYSFMDEKTLAYSYMQKAFSFAFTNIRADLIYDDLRILMGWALYMDDGEKALRIFNATVKRLPPVTALDSLFYFEAAGSCYSALHDYKKADYFFARMSRKSATLGPDEELEMHTSWTLGYAYLKRKLFIKARPHLMKALESFKYKDLSEVRQLGLLYALYQVDSATNRPYQALAYLRRYVEAKNAANIVMKNIQINELQISYQTEQRKKDIRILQEKEKVQRVGLERAQLTRNWILGGSGMLLLLLGVSYNGYRVKKRNNRELEAQRSEITEINSNLKGLLTQKEHLIQEKEWLLKELHHRVKNNLHLVICLLESQALYLQDDALKAIETSQHRIQAMSLIHQKLYLSQDVKHIDMSKYLPELVRYLSDSFGTEGRIAFGMDVAPLKIEAAQAIPLALIVNEVVTNSIKHAFPDNKSGNIEITLSDDQQQVTLQISDDGIGIDLGNEDRPQDSLGLTLIKGLSEDLNGTLSVENSNGTVIRITFSLAPEFSEFPTSTLGVDQNEI